MKTSASIISLQQRTKTVNSLPVMEHFYTLQGEGFHQGTAAYFIRLAGCDVGCVWCDVKESWDDSNYPLISIESLGDAADKFPSEICVITGGEPLMHDLTELTRALRKKNKKIHIETSGAYPVSGLWEWICVSPKKFKPPLPEILSCCNELKVIIFNRSDFNWAESFLQSINPQCHLYLQPEWSKQQEMLPLMIEYIKENPQWKISLQIHKYLNIP